MSREASQVSATRQLLLESALPLQDINKESVREGYIYKGNPSSLHKWWANRPLVSCRAVIFAQLVDQNSARGSKPALDVLLKSLARWESSNDPGLLAAARFAIARSLATYRQSERIADQLDLRVLDGELNDQEIRRFLADRHPPIYDPFTGAASIGIEAQRLGLRTYCSDLNPVALLLTIALTQVPQRFAKFPAVSEASKRSRAMRGLAQDVRHYGGILRSRALQSIGRCYPAVPLPNGGSATVLGFIWARTVRSPNPAHGGAHVPLIASFWLSSKKGKEAWLSPIIDRKAKSYRFEVRREPPPDTSRVASGTKLSRGGNFHCLLSGDSVPISPEYIREEGKAGRLSYRLLAVVAKKDKVKHFLPATPELESLGLEQQPAWRPSYEFSQNSRHMTPCVYGYTTIDALFLPRQLLMLDTFSGLVAGLRSEVEKDACSAGMPDDGISFESGGAGATAYADAIALILALSVSKMADYHCALIPWYAGESRTSHLFTYQAVPITWDFVENNPFAGVGGSFSSNVEIAASALESLHSTCEAPEAVVFSRDAREELPAQLPKEVIVCTDPPYYDNVPYADLSDLFYVWIRRALKDRFSRFLATTLVPKDAELVADSCRHGGKQRAEEFFMEGMKSALTRLAPVAHRAYPTLIFYAFRQSEMKKGEFTLTGWETFLQALTDAGFGVTGTWPVRTEREGRSRGQKSNALASSLVLACRPITTGTSPISRRDFRRALTEELPRALETLQAENIAPVDIAQAAIGPGMAAFSRFGRVLEADGTAMTVRTALQLINEALDEHLSAQDIDMDGDTRFAVTWFETYGHDPGPFGEAETLAKARNVSVSGVVNSGILKSAAGKVRLFRRTELEDDWSPEADNRLTVWEATQHLIKLLEANGESAAAGLLSRLGAHGGKARALAYRLFAACERRKWAEEARAYNALVVAWPVLERLAAGGALGEQPQAEMFDADEED